MEGGPDDSKKSNETILSGENGSKVNMLAAHEGGGLSRSNVSSHQQQQPQIDDDEELIFKNFPWLKVQILLILSHPEIN